MPLTYELLTIDSLYLITITPFRCFERERYPGHKLYNGTGIRGCGLLQAGNRFEIMVIQIRRDSYLCVFLGCCCRCSAGECSGEIIVCVGADRWVAAVNGYARAHRGTQAGCCSVCAQFGNLYGYL